MSMQPNTYYISYTSIKPWKMNGNLGPTKNLGTHDLPSKNEGNQRGGTPRDPSGQATMDQLSGQHNVLISWPFRFRDVENPWRLRFLWVPNLPKWPEIYGLSIGCDPFHHLPLTKLGKSSWRFGWLENHVFSFQKKKWVLGCPMNLVNG